MSKRFKVKINEQRCKKCGICVAFCPKKVLKIEINTFPIVDKEEECIGCNLCYLRCPDIAIFVEEKGEGVV